MHRKTDPLWYDFPRRMNRRRTAQPERMSYFNYHATAKRLIRAGKLTGWDYAERHRKIAPALVLVFDDVRHPVMPIRPERWAEYLPLLPKLPKVPPDQKPV